MASDSSDVAECLHPSVIAWWDDELRFDPPRCWDCGRAVNDPDRENEQERQAFLSFIAPSSREATDV